LSNLKSSDNNLALTRALRYLKSLQNENGFWPYLPNREGALEPSGWAAIACRDDQSCLSSFSKGLLQNQNGDGGWSNDSARIDSDWSTALALLALRQAGIRETSPGIFQKACKKGEDWLLENRAEYYTSGARFALLIWKGPEYSYPQGWPWSKNTYGWVEPTAYVLLSFRQSEQAKKEEVAQVLEQAEDFLINLCCKDGGWNFGDQTPFGRLYPPDVQSSTLAILALQTRKDDFRVKQSLKWLSERVGSMESVSEMSWAMLALSSSGENCNELIQKLLARQADDGSFSSNVLTQSVACLAFETVIGDSPPDLASMHLSSMRGKK